jgi:epoxyqueuosine reductase
VNTDITFEEIFTQAKTMGWDDCGITEARVAEADVAFYKEWVDGGKHGSLSYMENAVRCDPQAFFPGAKTALIFVTYYRQEKVPFRPDKGVVASYARGRDYHNIHRKRLKRFIRWLEERSGVEDVARGFSDSAPVMERALASQAGLGWMGKNTLLIHRRFGTFFLLSGLFTRLDIPHRRMEDTRFPRCGSCTRCLDACPTQALAPYKIDGARCLSYFLIESKEAVPDWVAQANPGYIFGCDDCQNVCPHNVRPPLSTAEEFQSEQGIGPYIGEDELALMEAEPEALFGTPLNRRGVNGLRLSWESLGERRVDLD